MPSNYYLTDSELPTNPAELSEALKLWASKRKGVKVTVSDYAPEMFGLPYTAVTVRHYDTAIVFAELTDQTMLQLDHGGYMSVMTKRFINEVLGIMRGMIGVTVTTYQEDYEWYTDYRNAAGICVAYNWQGSQLSFYI